MKKLWWIVVAIALTAAACGDSDGGGGAGAPADDPDVQALVAQLQSDEEFPVSDDEALCAARRLKSDLSDEQVQLLVDNPDANLDVIDDPEAALAAFDALFDCVDLEEFMVNGLMADGSTEEEARCVAEGFGEDELRGFIELGLQGEEAIDEEAAFEVLAKMFEVMGECGLSLG